VAHHWVNTTYQERFKASGLRLVKEGARSIGWFLCENGGGGDGGMGKSGLFVTPRYKPGQIGAVSGETEEGLKVQQRSRPKIIRARKNVKN